MIIALLLGLFVATYSGLKVYAIEEGEGPLARQAIEMNIITSAYADDDEQNMPSSTKMMSMKKRVKNSGKKYMKPLQISSCCWW